VDTRVDYINAHATSTPAGDSSELRAIKTVFGDQVPYINATKALTGHGLGAAGATEAVYSLLMMEHEFLCESANLVTPDEAAAGLPIVHKRMDNIKLNTVMSNSFGFGGTNGSLIFRKLAK